MKKVSRNTVSGTIGILFAVGLVTGFFIILFIFPEKILSLFTSPVSKFFGFLAIFFAGTPFVFAVSHALISDEPRGFIPFFQFYAFAQVDIIFEILFILFILPAIALSIIYILIGMLTIVCIIIILVWFVKYGIGGDFAGGLGRGDLRMYVMLLNYFIALGLLGITLNRWASEKGDSALDVFLGIRRIAVKALRKLFGC